MPLAQCHTYLEPHNTNIQGAYFQLHSKQKTMHVIQSDAIFRTIYLLDKISSK